MPFIVILFFLVMTVCWLLLRYLRIGRIAYAIGGNEYTTYLAGIPVRRYKILFYVICGFFAGLAGLVLASRISSAIPNMGTGFEMNSIGAAVIGGMPLTGGRGNVGGTFTGVLLLGIIANGLNLLHVDASWQYVVTGLIIIIAVIIHEQRLGESRHERDPHFLHRHHAPARVDARRHLPRDGRGDAAQRVGAVGRRGGEDLRRTLWRRHRPLRGEPSCRTRKSTRW